MCLTYPRPKDGDNDNKVGYNGQEPRRNKVADSRHICDDIFNHTMRKKRSISEHVFFLTAI